MEDLCDGLSVAVQRSGSHMSMEQVAMELERRDHNFHERTLVKRVLREVVRPEVNRVALAYVHSRPAAAVEAAQLNVKNGSDGSLAVELAKLVLSDDVAMERLRKGCTGILKGGDDGAGHHSAVDEGPTRGGHDGRKEAGADILDLLSPSDEFENSMERGDGRQTTRQRLMPCVADLLTSDEVLELRRFDEGRRNLDVGSSGSDEETEACRTSSKCVADAMSAPSKPPDLATIARTLYAVGVEDCLAFAYWQHVVRRACEGFTHDVDFAEQEKAAAFVLSMMRCALSEQLVLLFELFSVQCVGEYSRMDDAGRLLCTASWHSSALLVTERWAHLDAYSFKRISDAAIVASMQMDSTLSTAFPTAPWADHWFEKPLVANTVSLGPVLTSRSTAASPHLASVLACICTTRMSADCCAGLSLLIRFFEHSLLSCRSSKGRYQWTSSSCRAATLFCVDVAFQAIEKWASNAIPEAVALEKAFFELMLSVVKEEVLELPGEDEVVAAVAAKSIFSLRNVAEIDAATVTMMVCCARQMRDGPALVQCFSAIVPAVAAQPQHSLVAAELFQELLPRCVTIAGQHTDQLRFHEALLRNVLLLTEPYWAQATLKENLFAWICHPLLHGASSSVPAFYCCPPASRAVAPALSDVQQTLDLLALLSKEAPHLVHSFIHSTFKSCAWLRDRCSDESTLDERLELLMSAEAMMAALPAEPLNHVTFSLNRSGRQQGLASALRLSSLLVMLVVLNNPERSSSATLMSTILSVTGKQLKKRGSGDTTDAACYPPQVTHRLWRWALFAQACGVLFDVHSMASETTTDPQDLVGCDPIVACQLLVTGLMSVDGAEHAANSSPAPPSEVLLVASSGFDIDEESLARCCGEWCLGSREQVLQWSAECRTAVASSVAELIVGAAGRETAAGV